MERNLNPDLNKAHGFKKIDTSFEPNPVHLSIMKAARSNRNEYNRQEAIQKILASDNNQKLKRQMIAWNQTNLETLIEAGYLKKTDFDKYIANPDAYALKKRPFVPSKNHISILKKNRHGIIRTKDLIKENEDKPQKEQDRQKVFFRGMIKTLYSNGYLEKIKNGEYKLTDKAEQVINELSPIEKKNSDNQIEIKITAFDRNFDDILVDGKINEKLLFEHPRRDSITKRIKTLKSNGLILADGSITKKLELLLQRNRAPAKERQPLIDRLTKEQMKTLADMRVFLNLSKKQIINYVYAGDETCAEVDIAFMIKNKVINYDENYKVFVLGNKGIEMAKTLFPDAVKYGSKLYSRPEEIEHDMLVYTAYKEWEKGILKSGGTILEIKNDRQMRSEDAKKFGAMQGVYPDLRVYYEMPGTKQLQYDLEVDCGYDEKTIAAKIEGMGGTNMLKGETAAGTKKNVSYGTGGPRSMPKKAELGWYCKNLYQATKVMKVINVMTGNKTKVSRMNVHRELKVFYMDGSGRMQATSPQWW